METLQSNQTEEQRTEEADLTDKTAEQHKQKEEEPSAFAADEKKKQTKRFLISLFLAAMGGVLQAFSIYQFIKPNNMVAGGVLGIAIIIEHITGLSQGMLFLLFNLPLIILAFFKLGKKFTFLTLVYVVVQGGLSIVFKAIDLPLLHLQTDNSIILSIVAAIPHGIGLALALMSGGSTGGIDVLSVIYQRKHGEIDISWVMFTLNTMIILSSGFFYEEGFIVAINSIIMMFVVSKISDVILNGLSTAIRFEVVTTKGEEVKQEILAKLQRGVTEIRATGGYTGEEKTVIVCLIRKRQISEFKRILRDIDPKAFAYMALTNEVVGKGFVGK